MVVCVFLQLTDYFSPSSLNVPPAAEVYYTSVTVYVGFCNVRALVCAYVCVRAKLNVSDRRMLTFGAKND